MDVSSADLLVTALSDITSNGNLFLTLGHAVNFNERSHDLILEWRRRDEIWDREALGHLPTLVSSLHEFSMKIQGETLIAKGRIDPDFWCAVYGKFEVKLSRNSLGAWVYDGHFGELEIQGAAVLLWEDAPRPSLGTASETLKILQHYQEYGCAGRLYDYSYAGRDTAHEFPEDLPVIDAQDYGVKANSGQECLTPLQAAVDAVGALGGGIIQLPAGVLDANVKEKLPPLLIRHDRVYLRGAGSDQDGTMIVNHRYSDTPEPDSPWLAGLHPLMRFEPQQRIDKGHDATALCSVTAGKRGNTIITVDSVEGLKPGMTVLLRQLEDAEGSLAKDLVQGQVEVASNYQGQGKALVTQLAVIKAIEGQQVTLDAPLHRDVTNWKTELCDFPMIRGGGVAYMRITGHWGGFFVHHKNGEHDNGWDHIKLNQVYGALIHDVVHEHTTSAVGLKSSLGCVIRDCRIEGNPGHNGYVNAEMSTGNLLLRCHAGRNMHGINLQGTPCGNAFVDCTVDEPGGVDLHGGTCLDNLVDSLVGGVLKGGGGPGAVPPRHASGFVLWNWRCGHYDPYKIWKRVNEYASSKETPGYVAVGLHGAYGQMPQVGTPEGPRTENIQESWGWIESLGQRVEPRSLYRWMKDKARH